ncbi:MAG: hypothetical protein RL071_1661 [Pseudomonadota bacterium]
MTFTTLLLALGPALGATDHTHPRPLSTPEAERGPADTQRTAAEGPRWGIGARGGVWSGEHRAPSLGGRIRIQPWDRVGIELFEQSAARPDLRADTLWHAHVIGFHLLIPVLPQGRPGATGGRPAPGATALGATVGACVAAEALSPLSDDRPSVVDLRFAPHAGVFVERGINRHLSAGLRATGFVYAGNAPALDGWSATTSNRLSIDPVGELQATVTLWR